jgi:hypothetical protein
LIPESFIQELLHRVDIVDLIDAHVPLRKAGANYAACCPFHNEKTPSFTVSPTKQFYHCFGCGAHGTAIGFLMEYSGLGFVDAIKDLAARVGMQVPDDGARAHDGPRLPALNELMARASRYYYEQLKRSEKAIAYLKQRGVSGEIAQRFGIGYAPDGWQNLAAVFEDYSASGLQQAGLVIRNDQGRLYDRFRDRVMFPIVNPKGDVIAFGGRVLGAGRVLFRWRRSRAQGRLARPGELPGGAARTEERDVRLPAGARRSRQLRACARDGGLRAARGPGHAAFGILAQGACLALRHDQCGGAGAPGGGGQAVAGALANAAAASTVGQEVGRG